MSLFEQIENKKSSFSGKKREVLEQFLKQGFPTKKEEEYKYTNLKEIIEKDYSFSPKASHNITKEQLNQLHLGEENFEWIVFVNGRLHKELSNITIENAEFFARNGAAVVIPDEKASPDFFCETVQRFISEPDYRDTMAAASQALANSKPAKTIAALLLQRTKR